MFHTLSTPCSSFKEPATWYAGSLPPGLRGVTKNQECLCSIQYLLPIHLSRECTVVGNIWQLGVGVKTLVGSPRELGVDFKTLVGDIIGMGGEDIVGLVGIVRTLDTGAMEEIRESEFCQDTSPTTVGPSASTPFHKQPSL